MNVVVFKHVREFVDELDIPVRADIDGLVNLLGQYGPALSMPYAKPLGRGLWELRRTGRPQIRILYGFCNGSAILVLAIKKQRSALRHKDIDLARKRLLDSE
ncbi:type II toxin-antitoxin system RelE/ParE family toxin [Candidatus Kaiserbacteria bacterium]|nr:type II toxin-antitoxin system RelE/ParE family toxin [Candidatus Kaiserbacteria bacterium]